MKYIQVLIASAAAISSNAFTVRNLEAPEQIGDFHNEAFQRLNDALELVNGDLTEEDLDEHVISVISSFCDEGDDECTDAAYDAVVNAKEKRSSDILGQLEAFSEELDASVIELITSVHEAVHFTKDTDSEAVLETLNDLMDQAMSMEAVNEVEKSIAVGATSVAIASTKLWTNIGSNPSKRALVEKSAKFSRCASARCLDELGEDVSIVEYDIAGFLAGLTGGAVLGVLQLLYAPILYCIALFQSIAWSLYGFIEVIGLINWYLTQAGNFDIP